MLGTPWPTSLVKTASFPSSEEPCLTGMSQRVIEEAIQHLLLALSELCIGICICTLVCATHPYTYTTHDMQHAHAPTQEMGAGM